MFIKFIYVYIHINIVCMSVCVCEEKVTGGFHKLRDRVYFFGFVFLDS